MNKIAALCSAVATVVCAIPSVGHATDLDPGFGPDRPWSGGRRSELSVGNGNYTPLYYRPTQRYYGAGYTVNYRYVPVYRGDSIYSVPVTGASNFRNEAFRLSADGAVSWGATSPRLVVKDPRSAAPRTAVTSIVRKKTTTKSSTKPTETPTIVPSTDGPAPIAPLPPVPPVSVPNP